MPTDKEYALMAGAAYFSTRGSANRLPAPDGWTEISHKIGGLGFEASVFKKGNEIVISFAGTGTTIDWVTNILLAETGSGLTY